MDHLVSHLNHILTIEITISICIHRKTDDDDFESFIFQYEIDYCIICYLIKMLLYLKQNNFLFSTLS